ncbi:MBL fold metallo-hydrolase [Methanoplanus sp. FWC-SCC4]|uniref:MBL fold metallo-hydrolase n=1 Tax=Methanochimaera problematica TaxID=2609417 RepID=A0AA97FBY0_9EURY|nr:MBL fold metallo-hydrolase [Methanoplanus sp. FWC-SCC4]WOF15423.1 MBL fold metallo-hydrolase [Methanoplanus sp. FWC-SCC4]
MFTVIEIYNNCSFDSSFRSEFGYSCYIKEAGLLFDTGGNGDILLKNLEAAGIGPEDIERLVISHDHWDHTGGLKVFFEKNKYVDAYFLNDFSEGLLEAGRKNSSLNIIRGWTEIYPDIFLTGSLGDDIKEQSLAIRSDSGYFVIAGCSHPHICNILSFIRKFGEVKGVIGGLHDVSDDDLRSLSGIDYIAVSHCTKRISEIEEMYGPCFKKSGVGFVHRI